MFQHNTIKTWPASAPLVGAVTIGAMAAVGLGSAPAASADCISFMGIGNSANCTSTILSVAYASGNGQAHADGLIGAAISTGGQATIAKGGLVNLAVAGSGDVAQASGLLTGAFALGPTSTSIYGPPNNSAFAGPSPMSVAIAYTVNFGEIVTQSGFGINVNGSVFPSAAAARNRAASAAATHHAAKPAATGTHSSTRPAAVSSRK